MILIDIGGVSPRKLAVDIVKKEDRIYGGLQKPSASILEKIQVNTETISDVTDNDLDHSKETTRTCLVITDLLDKTLGWCKVSTSEYSSKIRKEEQLKEHIQTAASDSIDVDTEECNFNPNGLKYKTPSPSKGSPRVNIFVEFLGQVQKIGLKIRSELFMLCLSLLVCTSFANTTDVRCLTVQNIRLGERGTVKCESLTDLSEVYWYNTSDQKDPVAFIQKVDGIKYGKGYSTGQYDIETNGSLIINNVTSQHEQTFTVEMVSTSFKRETHNINVQVYVEQPKPVSLISECDDRHDCIMKAEPDSFISCVHKNARPAAEISWYIRDGFRDIPLITTSNQTVSSDLGTFTTTSYLSIDEIPAQYMYVEIICKSIQPISVIQDFESKIVLDLSRDEHSVPSIDPTVSQIKRDVHLECQPNTLYTNTSRIMWTKKRTNRNHEYLIYSVYGETVFNLKSEQHFTLTSGGLRIKDIRFHHDGLYACFISNGNYTRVFHHRLEVVVPPTPGKILVKGCDVFGQCRLPSETRNITCEVRDVYPAVTLSIKALTSNVIVTETDPKSNEVNGLTSVAVYGTVTMSKGTCGEDIVVQCRAIGLAAYVFNSEVDITIVNDKGTCKLASSAVPDSETKEEHVERINLSFLRGIPVIIMFGLFFGIGIILKMKKRQEQVRSLLTETGEDGGTNATPV
ncbi:hypothetical protein BSL78_16480 [Apostichopus japonicus]|uniref:Ig-like domain-containing protein n=1 Tax=Stichopus japonicus TaxID=307972 RepID=A0A2G8KF66_STIJA|nr:hypothetical protein BSL78_16480 [Apostichopus japonicus]